MKIAVFQMNSGIDPRANMAAIEDAAMSAARQGARVLFTPEMALLLDRNRERASAWINSDAPQAAIEQMAAIAVREGIDIALGSLPIALGGQSAKWANRSVYLFADGRAPVTYDKLHMFDVDLASGEKWRESRVYEPGKTVVSLKDTPLGRLGLTICYDVRFPALFEALGQQKCDAIAIPAAFTVPTGKAHWHVLMRARAIEASAFVIAASQVGQHEDGRETYGHALVVDPWGEVLLDLGSEGPRLGICELDLSRIAAVRAQVPSLDNRQMP